MQTAQQPSLFDTLPPPSPATVQTVLVRQHPRRVRAATTLPHVRGSETSRAAAEQFAGKSAGQEARVLAVLRLLGPLTDREIEERLAGEMLNGSARRSRIALTRKGEVRQRADKKRAASGAMVWVWEAVK